MDVNPSTNSSRHWLKDIERTRSKIDPGLRAHINSVVTGRRPWPLTLIGGVGTGKTLAALCLLDSSHGIFTTVSDMCDATRLAMQGELWDYWGYEGRTNTLQYWYRWREARLTVLDEIGSRKEVSDHHYDCVKRALDSREGKPCAYISNLSLEKIASVYDDRIASRLSAGTLVNMAGNDKRTERQEF